ncbi:MAG: tryptophan synthase subunit alpha [Acidobacteriota bacterium]
MTRISVAFERLMSENRTGLVPFVTAGDPDLRRTVAILQALAEAGADIVEIGVPFSDPLADGPVIQRASERALRSGTTLRGTLDMVATARRLLDVPIVLFSYANPIWRMGVPEFVDRAAEAGVDGVLVLDVPVEEAEELRVPIRNAGLDMIFLVSPTSTRERIRRAQQRGSGFLYAISRLGVTGARRSLAEGVEELVGRIRLEGDLPIAVGFGISIPDHVREVGRYADAAVIGSALVNVIAGAAELPDMVARVARFVSALKDGTNRS